MGHRLGKRLGKGANDFGDDLVVRVKAIQFIDIILHESDIAHEGRNGVVVCELQILELAEGDVQSA